MNPMLFNVSYKEERVLMKIAVIGFLSISIVTLSLCMDFEDNLSTEKNLVKWRQMAATKCNDLSAKEIEDSLNQMAQCASNHYQQLTRIHREMDESHSRYETLSEAFGYHRFRATEILNLSIEVRKLLKARNPTSKL